MYLTLQHEAAPPRRAPRYRQQYAPALLAMILGALLGHLWPALAGTGLPGDGFVRLAEGLCAAMVLPAGLAGVTACRVRMEPRTARSKRVSRSCGGRLVRASARSGE